MPSLNRARHQTTVHDETDKLALVDHKAQCCQNLLEIAKFLFFIYVWFHIFLKVYANTAMRTGFSLCSFAHWEKPVMKTDFSPLGTLHRENPHTVQG